MRRYANFVAVAIGIVAVAAPASPTIAGAAGPLRIRLATLAPAGTSYERILKEMGEKWRKSTNGQVTLTIYPGGNQGSEATSVRLMASGNLQAGMLTAGGLSEIDPAVAALQEIPMLFRSLAEQEYVREQMRPELEKRLLAKGFVALFWADSGWVRFFSRTPGVRPDDFKAQKLFVTAGDARTMEIMQALGYKPVPLEWSDVLTSMQTRMIDAVPAPPLIALAGQYYRYTRHMTEVNWVPLVGATVVTRRAWDEVLPAMREALMKAAAEAGTELQTLGRRDNEEAVETMQKKWGLQVHTVSSDVEAEWRALAERAYSRIRGTLVPSDMFDQAKQRVEAYRATHKAGR